MTLKSIQFTACAICLALFAATPAFAQDKEDAAALSKKTNNPIASLISVPIEYNKDTDIGPDKTGEQESIKFSPVIPFEISDDWNMISRTIFSYVDQDIPEFGIDESGWSDIALTLYFTPKETGPSGVIWGVGPIFLLDTATEDSLGAGKWGLGPAAVALKQEGAWTVGGLTYYLREVDGDDDREDVEQAFLQPFVSYQMANGKTSFTLQSEITRDLEKEETGAFALFQVNQLFSVGSQILQGRIGVRHWYERAEFGPDSTELNLRLTFLFPQ